MTVFLRLTRIDRTFCRWRISLWSLPSRPNTGAAALNGGLRLAPPSPAALKAIGVAVSAGKEKKSRESEAERRRGAKLHTVLRFSARFAPSTFDPRTRSEDARRRFCDEPPQRRSSGGV